MLLYTIMPYDAIFPPDPQTAPELKPIKGGFVSIVNTPEGRTLSRLISTDPRMYLNGLKPGDPYV